MSTSDECLARGIVSERIAGSTCRESCKWVEEEIKNSAVECNSGLICCQLPNKSSWDTIGNWLLRIWDDRRSKKLT